MATRRPPSRELVRTAVHEAAHAAIGIEVGMAWRRVTIIPNEELGSVGSVTLYVQPKLRERLMRARACHRERAWFRRRAMFVLAGPIAERMFSRGSVSESGNIDDYTRVVSIASRLHRSHQEAEVFVRQTWSDTYALLSTPRIARGVDQIATLLLKRGTVHRSELFVKRLGAVTIR